jgi:hypothetical protein
VNEAELLFFIEQKLKQREEFYTTAEVILPAETLNNKSLQIIMGHE